MNREDREAHESMVEGARCIDCGRPWPEHQPGPCRAVTPGEQAAVLLARLGLDVALYRQRKKVEQGDIALETIEAFRKEAGRPALDPRTGREG